MDGESVTVVESSGGVVQHIESYGPVVARTIVIDYDELDPYAWGSNRDGLLWAVADMLEELRSLPPGPARKRLRSDVVDAYRAKYGRGRGEAQEG